MTMTFFIPFCQCFSEALEIRTHNLGMKLANGYCYRANIFSLRSNTLLGGLQNIYDFVGVPILYKFVYLVLYLMAIVVSLPRLYDILIQRLSVSISHQYF